MMSFANYHTLAFIITALCTLYLQIENKCYTFRVIMTLYYLYSVCGGVSPMLSSICHPVDKLFSWLIFF